MAKFKAPGDYIEEISTLPPSIAQVETAIPVFIGYTEKTKSTQHGDMHFQPIRLSTMVEFEQYFGKAEPKKGLTFQVDEALSVSFDRPIFPSHNMYYSMQAFFSNGGSKCYIVSVGDFQKGEILKEDLIKGLEAAGNVDEVTLNVFPEGTNMKSAADYYELLEKSLAQCSKQKDRFTICDVFRNQDAAVDDIDQFRAQLNSDPQTLKYGAAYYPHLLTSIHLRYEDKDVIVHLSDQRVSLTKLKDTRPKVYNVIQTYLKDFKVTLPPSPLIAGVYSAVDHSRGVWKAPANVSLSSVIKPIVNITNHGQERLNVDVNAGKSINAIRTFIGKGVMVWGARTLAGNDNEWRYVPVRRFFNMVEESIQKALNPFVFEPNDANVWAKVKAMIENFLTLQWKVGALIGAKSEDAFFVNVGLGQTMNAQDIVDGRMIVEIGMAVVRPAEFIILRITQKIKNL